MSEQLIGRVKWFNNKAGYGFITVTDGDRSGTDIFVHHSSISVNGQQYKYLVQGEYVEFYLIKVDNDKHEWQASNVSGIKGGKLMCETRYETKVARNEYKINTTKPTPNPIVTKQRDSPKNSDWTPVGKKQSPRGGARVNKKGSTIITIQSK